MVRGHQMGCYELDDKAAQRSLWVQVYGAGHATQVQIARYLKIGLRTFHGWVGRYRESGMAGLLDQPKSGRPAVAKEAKGKLVMQSRSAGKTVLEIARIANLSVSTVHRILGRKQPNADPVAELALGTSASSESPVAAVAEPALMEPAVIQKAAGVEAGSVPVMESMPLAGAAVEQIGLLPAAGVLRVGVEAAVKGVGGEVASVEALLAAREGSLSSSTPGIDPLDRSADRAFARLGLLEDAPPVFAPGQNLPWVGAFLALALLEKDPLLKVASRVFGDRKSVV